MAWTVEWKVYIDGKDMTSAMRPYLINISVSDKDGTASDACSLELDDAGGQIKLPAEGAALRVFLQGSAVFSGTVDDVRSRGSRGGGRVLSVNAKGFNAKGKAKEAQSHHMDDATLQQFMDKAAGNAGLKGITIDPEFAGIARDYWSAGAESFLHLGQKIARELGGTFKIRGDRAVLAKRGQGLSPSGQPMPAVMGVVPAPGQSGGNVISWDISPIAGRSKFSRSKVRYFDRKSAAFKEVEVETDIEDAEATDEVRTAAVDEEHATALAKGRKAASERDAGQGSVELDLEVSAQAEGTFVLTGARPGIDGVYRISGVDHKASRSGGATTRLELKQPTQGAGKDKRRASIGAGGSGDNPSGGNGSAGGAGGGRADSFTEHNRKYGRTDEN